MTSVDTPSPDKWIPGGGGSPHPPPTKPTKAPRTPTKAPKSKGSSLRKIITIIGGIIAGIMVLMKISDWLSGGSSSSSGRTYQCINGHTMTSAFIPGKCIWCGSTMWPK